MKILVTIIIAFASLCQACLAYCQSTRTASINSETSLMQAIERTSKEQIEARYRKFLSCSPVRINIVDVEIETRRAPSKDDEASYDINLYYEDATPKGCSDRLIQIAMTGACLAQHFKNAEIGSITAMPVFPFSGEKGQKKVRGMVVINYALYHGKDLFSRIYDGDLRKDDIHAMNSWSRTWKGVRLDPEFDAVSITFK